MVNLKAQSLGESLNSKMVGLRLLHLNSRLVKSSTSIYYIFMSFKTERKVLGNEAKNETWSWAETENSESLDVQRNMGEENISNIS